MMAHLVSSGMTVSLWLLDRRCRREPASRVGHGEATMSDPLSTGIGQQGHDVIEAQTFWDLVMSLSRDDRYRGQLLETMLELRRQPFRNPKLQTHDVGKARNGRPIFSSDLGGRRSDRRLVWQYGQRDGGAAPLWHARGAGSGQANADRSR